MKLVGLKSRVRSVDLSIARAPVSLPSPSATPRIRGRKRMQRNQRLTMRQPLCVHCAAEGVIHEGEEWDHIEALADGGAEHESNLQHLCRRHHDIKSRADAARRWQR